MIRILCGNMHTYLVLRKVGVGWMRFQELGLWEVRFCWGVILFIREG
jgi:hypothetical protein